MKLDFTTMKKGNSEVFKNRLSIQDILNVSVQASVRGTVSGARKTDKMEFLPLYVHKKGKLSNIHFHECIPEEVDRFELQGHIIYIFVNHVNSRSLTPRMAAQPRV